MAKHSIRTGFGRIANWSSGCVFFVVPSRMVVRIGVLDMRLCELVVARIGARGENVEVKGKRKRRM